jgi:hypothetical protein
LEPQENRIKAGLFLVLLAAMAAPAACAHAISMSTGYATVSGARVDYLVRMPSYEMGHVKDATHALFSHIRFTSGFETGRATGQECHDDPSSGSYLCAATYEFSQPVERLGVECTFYEVTVGNHIHMLHAERAGKSDQAILDSAFSSATLAFRPPTAAELAVEQAGAGAIRVWTNSVQLLLLIALAVAARNRSELLVTGAAFVAGECAGALAITRSAWQPSPRFAEAAVALALVYLAFEIIAFPKSRGRWILALLFGAFTGMYFSIFLAQSGYQPGWVLTGAAAAAIAVLALAMLLGYALRKLRLTELQYAVATRIAASGLLVTGAVWFVVRLRG